MAAPSGVIVGGWSYVIASYALSAVVLVGYTLALLIRLRRISRDPARIEAPPETDTGSD